MRIKFKHLGRVLTPAQIGCLFFASSEGEVGPGAHIFYARNGYNQTSRARRSTIAYLVGAGLLQWKSADLEAAGRGDGWTVLTARGESLVAEIKAKDPVS
jgi:hypothetical protein